MELKTYSRKQLAAMYHIDPKTFKKWMDDADFKFGKRLLTPMEIQMIFEKFGYPDETTPHHNNDSALAS
jgi:hypothetical protein